MSWTLNVSKHEPIRFFGEDIYQRDYTDLILVHRVKNLFLFKIPGSFKYVGSPYRFEYVGARHIIISASGMEYAQNHHIGEKFQESEQAGILLLERISFALEIFGPLESHDPPTNPPK